jgi:hypothetical protein
MAAMIRMMATTISVTYVAIGLPVNVGTTGTSADSAPTSRA